MKILLIGKNGQVGREIDKLSRKLKYEKFSFGQKDLNILDYNRVREKIKEVKPDVVINTAAYHVVPECEKFPERAFAINSAAEKMLADICREGKIKLVYFSTDKVFDGEKIQPYKETDLANPIQMYGLSKFAGEIATLNYNSNSIVVRTSIIFGGVEGSREKKGNFVLYILNQAKKVSEIEISSEQVSSFAYAPDLALGVLALIKKKATGVFNVVNEGHASSAEFAQEIVKVRELKLKVKPVDRHGIYGGVRTPIFTALNTAKLNSLNIKLPHWKLSLKKYLEFLQENKI